MKILQINGGVFGSTGKIMFGISNAAREKGHTVMCASPITSTNRSSQPREEYIRIGSYNTRRLNVLLAYITGLEGCFAYFATSAFLRKVKKFSPDVIHIHSIHNSYLNISMLFRYIKKHKIKTVWTLHDCWAFTGHCPHFESEGCYKWKSQCGDCPKYREYPKSFFDNSKMMHRLKKKWFSGVEDMTIVTPSRWLADLVGQSFLGQYPVKVINNGIDLSVFKPTESDFRVRHGLCDKKIVLGVAFGWGYKKGLDVFCRLAEMLDDTYRIVLVGTDEKVERELPENVISIHRTQNQRELAEIYTAADVFVNPTREDTFPTVNMEATACGTPVVTFDTGGSCEAMPEGFGCGVDKDDIDELLEKAELYCIIKDASESYCEGFSKERMYENYLELYR